MLTRNPATTTLTPVQQRVVREIVALVRRERQRAGDHLTEVSLAGQLGTSRSPVRAALAYLVECGVLERRSTHGLALTKDAADWTAVATRLASWTHAPLDVQIADERRMGLLPDVVSELELMRRYSVSRSTLCKVLTRMADEGWIEQRVGRGWCFLPMTDSLDASEESRLYRQAVEPSGLLMPSFQFAGSEMDELRHEQQRIAECGGRGMTSIELFEANNRFHETLARWSHNRFVLQSVRRVNSLRRVFEHRQGMHTEAHDAGAPDHLKILDAIETQEMARAASLLRLHLYRADGDRPFDRKLMG